MSNDFTEINFRLALRRRAAAIAAHKAEVRKRERAEEQLLIFQEALANVWRWSNDEPLAVELLLPILREADSDVALIRALDAIELPA